MSMFTGSELHEGADVLRRRNFARRIKGRFFRIAMFLCCATALTTQAQQSRGYRFVEVPKDVVPIYGNGFDYIADVQLTQPCITFDANTLETSKEYSDKSKDIYQEVTQTMEVDSSIDIDYRSAAKEGIAGASSNQSFEATVAAKAQYNADKFTFLMKRTIGKSPTVVNPVSVKMIPEMADLQKTNPTAFHEACGDYYVAGYTQGSRFYGIINIDKTALDIKLDAGMTMTEAVETELASEDTSTAVKTEVHTHLTSENTQIEEFTKGGPLLKGATDIESLKADYQSFSGNGSTEVNAAALKYILAPYPYIAPKITTQQDRLLTNNSKLWFRYNQLLATAEAAQSSPWKFVPFRPDTGAKWYSPSIYPTEDDKDSFRNVRDKISAQLDKIQKGIAACESDVNTCTDLTASGVIAADQSPAALRKLLPLYVGLADRCSALAVQARRFGMAPPPDSDYVLFYQGRQRQAYLAACKRMSIQPATYFKLSYPENNYSETAPDAGHGEQYYKGTKVHTTFDSVLIDPDTLEVNLSDQAGVHSTTGSITTNHGDGISSCAYGSAAECESYSCGTAHGQIYMVGTNFAVDPDKSALSVGGWKLTDNNGGGTFAYSDRNQTVSFSSPCGTCGSSAAQKLVLKPLKGGQ